jgi:outer membrane protein OmpA-like peptidoglycan-associated protein
MKKYPKMVVEIGTHSDIRGNNRYNLELSQKRATSARMYFIENGIKPERVIAIGYGETQPLIKCKTEDACTEEQHETNRRCEFVVKQIY